MYSPLLRPDRRVERRVVAIPGVPGPGPEEADRAEQHEEPPPGQDPEQGRHQHRRQAAAEVGPREEDPLRRAPLDDREPSRECPGHVGERPRLAGPEQEADRQERPEVEGRRGGDREARPPGDDPRQDPAGPDPVPPGPGGHLEEGVGQRERAEDQAHLPVREVQLTLDRGGHARVSDADPIQVSDRRQGDGHRQDPVADPGPAPGRFGHGAVSAHELSRPRRRDQTQDGRPSRSGCSLLESNRGGGRASI